MTPEQLEAIRARERAAKAGPWFANVNDMVGGWCVGTVKGSPCETHAAVDIADMIDEATAEFVAHARTDIPLLLAEVARLRNTNALDDAKSERLIQRINETLG